jgi:hypothetical protein
MTGTTKMLKEALTLNKDLSAEEADVLAQTAIRYLARNLIAAAEAMSLKVTINLVPKEPLSTASVTAVTDIRRKRILEDKGAYLMPEQADVKRVLNKAFGAHALAHVLFEAQQELKQRQ